MGNVAENEVEALERTALECELWAQQPELAYWDKANLLDRAENYRKRRDEILAAQTEPERVSGTIWIGAAVALLLELGFFACILLVRWLWLIL